MADEKAGATLDSKTDATDKGAGTTGEATKDSSATTKETAGATDVKAGTDKSADSKEGADKGIISDGVDKGDGTDTGKPDATKEVAPEKYEPFKLPEGFVADEEANKQFVEFAKASGLTQAKAQKAVDLYASVLAQNKKAMDEQYNAMKKEWYDDSMKMMGVNATKEKTFIAKAREGFFDKGAIEVLRDSGLENHPGIVRAFIKIGKAIADDTVVDGGKGGGNGTDKTRAEILYPNLKP